MLNSDQNPEKHTHTNKEEAKSKQISNDSRTKSSAQNAVFAITVNEETCDDS